MDWSRSRLLLGSGGVGDNTLGERSRFCRANLSFGSITRWVAALNDLVFAARRNLYRVPRLAFISSEGSLAPILRSL